MRKFLTLLSKRLTATIALMLSSAMIVDSLQASPLASPLAPLSSVVMPPALANITDAYFPPSDRTQKPDVILIQNLHVNRSVQFGISKILGRLKEDHLLPRQIAVEGSTGPNDVSSMQAYPRAEIRKKASDYLVEQGEMPGAMHFVVTEGQGGLYGVETSELYNANVEVFQRSYEARTQLKQALDQVSDTLPSLIRNPELKNKALTLQSDIENVNRLINIQTTPDEMSATLSQMVRSIERVKSVLPSDIGDSLLETLSAGAHFYAFALLRNEDLFKNTMILRQTEHQQTTVLITGGFHTKSLADQCKAAGLSYVVITPVVRTLNSTDERLYVERLLGHHLTPDQVAQGINWASTEQLEPIYRTATLFGAAVDRATRSPWIPAILFGLATLLPAAFSQTPVPAQKPADPFTSLTNVAKFIHEQRAEDGKGLPRTFRLPAGSVMPDAASDLIVRKGTGLYDTALAIHALVDAGKFKEAQEIINIYMEGFHNQMQLKAYPSGENKGAFEPFTEKNAYFFNFTSGDGSWTPKWTFWNAHTGPNAWLAIAVSHFIVKSGNHDPAYVDMVRRLGDAMMLLQDNETQGGIRYGPKGEYFVPGPSANDPYYTINSENVVSAYGAFKAIYLVTGETKYKAAGEKLLHWMFDANVYNKQTGQMQKGLMNPQTHTFYVGANYNRDQRRWEIEPLTATDSGGTWTISSIGPATIDAHRGKRAAFDIWQSIRSEMGWTAEYQRPRAEAKILPNTPYTPFFKLENGRMILDSNVYKALTDQDIVGLDFNNRYPGSQALISPEWTAGGVKAVEELIEHYGSGAGKGLLSTKELDQLIVDKESMSEWLKVHPNHYADGPGMKSPRNGSTGWGWISGQGDAMAAIYARLSGDPLAPEKSTTFSAPTPAVQEIVPASAPKTVLSPKTDTGLETIATHGSPWTDHHAYSYFSNGDYDFSNIKTVRLTFDTSAAGTKFKLRLVPQGADFNQSIGVNDEIFTIPADGIVTFTLKPSAFGLDESQLKHVSQIAVLSGDNAWNESLSQPADRHALFRSIEISRTSSVSVSPKTPAAPSDSRRWTSLVTHSSGQWTDHRAFSIYSVGHFDLSHTHALKITFGAGQAGAKFKLRLIPQGENPNQEVGVSNKIFTIPSSGEVIIPLKASDYDLSLSQLSEISQIAVLSGDNAWNDPLGQAASVHAIYQKIESEEGRPSAGLRLPDGLKNMLGSFSPSRTFRVSSVALAMTAVASGATTSATTQDPISYYLGLVGLLALIPLFMAASYGLRKLGSPDRSNQAGKAKMSFVIVVSLLLGAALTNLKTIRQWFSGTSHHTQTSATTPSPVWKTVSGGATGEWSGQLAFSSYATGSFDFSTAKTLRITFAPSQAGTKFMIRLIPNRTDVNQEIGVREIIETIPDSGVVEIAFNAADFGLDDSQLKNVSQIAILSGDNAWNHPLGQPENKHAVFQKLEAAEQAENLKPTTTAAESSTQSWTKIVAGATGQWTDERAFSVYAEGHYVLTAVHSLRITFSPNQAGVRFKIRLLAKGANANQPDGLNSTIFTVPENGVFTTAFSPGDFGLSASELGDIEQITVLSGDNAWNESLGQTADKRAKFSSIETSESENTAILLRNSTGYSIAFSKIREAASIVALGLLLVLGSKAAPSQPITAGSTLVLEAERAQIISADRAGMYDNGPDHSAYWDLETPIEKSSFAFIDITVQGPKGARVMFQFLDAKYADQPDGIVDKAFLLEHDGLNVIRVPVKFVDPKKFNRVVVISGKEAFGRYRLNKTKQVVNPETLRFVDPSPTTRKTLDTRTIVDVTDLSQPTETPAEVSPAVTETPAPAVQNTSPANAAPEAESSTNPSSNLSFSLNDHYEGDSWMGFWTAVDDGDSAKILSGKMLEFEINPDNDSIKGFAVEIKGSNKRRGLLVFAHKINGQWALTDRNGTPTDTGGTVHMDGNVIIVSVPIKAIADGLKKVGASSIGQIHVESGIQQYSVDLNERNESVSVTVKALGARNDAALLNAEPNAPSALSGALGSLFSSLRAVAGFSIFAGLASSKSVTSLAPTVLTHTALAHAGAPAYILTLAVDFTLTVVGFVLTLMVFRKSRRVMIKAVKGVLSNINFDKVTSLADGVRGLLTTRPTLLETPLPATVEQRLDKQKKRMGIWAMMTSA